MIIPRQAIPQLQVATMLLTRLPAGNLTAPIPKLSDSVWAFPLVGLAVGAFSALGLAVALGIGMPPTLAAGIALIAGVLTTGALHEDGLADVADGFGGGQTRARKLEIMRDSRIGSYGTLALILSVGLRWQALALAAAISPSLVVCGVVAIAMISRAGLPAMMVALPPARGDGLGRGAAGGDWTGAAIAVAIGVGAAAVLLGPMIGVFVTLGLVVTLVGLCALAKRQIGGQTGDVLGAAQQLCDVTAWVILVALSYP